MCDKTSFNKMTVLIISSTKSLTVFVILSIAIYSGELRLLLAIRTVMTCIVTGVENQLIGFFLNQFLFLEICLCFSMQYN